MTERRHALAVGDVDVGAGLDERPHRLLMAVPALPEDHRLEERRPAEIVDMVERRAGADQLPDDAVMPEMRRRDERRAVIDAGDELALAPPAISASTIAASSRTAAIVTAS